MFIPRGESSDYAATPERTQRPGTIHDFQGPARSLGGGSLASAAHSGATPAAARRLRRSHSSFGIDQGPGIIQCGLQGTAAQYGLSPLLPSGWARGCPNGELSFASAREPGAGTLAWIASPFAEGRDHPEPTLGGRFGRTRCHRSDGRCEAHLEKKDQPSVPRRIRQTGAARGARSGKSGQSNYFVGYKKHSLYGVVRHAERFSVLPLISLVVPANQSDVEMLMPLVEAARQGTGGVWPLQLVIADKGYIGEAQAALLRLQWRMGLLVAPRKDMRPPTGCGEQGCPLCPRGEALVWEDYDPEDGGWLIYQGARQTCSTCELAGTCARQFEIAAGINETFWGMVPSHSRLCRELLRKFRPRIEQSFSLAKNKFWLKGFFLNSLELARQLCAMSDVLEVLKFLAEERPQRGHQTKKALQQDLQAPEFWEKF